MSGRLVPVADVNVTPLIDVMLVLLIIFMVVTPLAHHGLDAALPAPRPSRAPTEVPRPASLVVEIGPAGYGLPGEPAGTVIALESRLRDLIAVRTDKTVFVKAAGDVTYGYVVSGLDAVRGAGAERIGLIQPQ